MREEGGTPAIVEAVRAGMAVQLKEAACGSGFVGEREDALMRRVRCWRADGRLGRNFVLLGNSQAWLPDGYSRIFRIVCVWLFGLLYYGSATLRCKI